MNRLTRPGFDRDVLCVLDSDALSGPGRVSNDIGTQRGFFVCAIDGCEGKAISRGWCMKHYTRWLRHGDARKVLNLKGVSATERFWIKVLKTETCWLWQGALSAEGYGKFRVEPRTIYAHRFAFEEIRGPIPAGLVLDHLCRVPSCVNPSHLDPVTQTVNILRGEAPRIKVHHARVCSRGHEVSAETTYVGKSGWRQCRLCKNLRRRKTQLSRHQEECEGQE